MNNLIQTARELLASKDVGTFSLSEFEFGRNVIDICQALIEAEEVIKFNFQAAHQGHHDFDMGSCKKATCMAARTWLSKYCGEGE